ncbi:hypothetical protein Q9L58_009200 [Maublancomyces gigas]|uniref:Uncharacterized protein n=1 Tax=Discina gigas TaxID=1032678 RepID=A0ABR3G809_9PEZI
MDLSAASTAAESFEKHDLEFRTITTLLNILGSSGRITLHTFEVPQRHRCYLKLLVALSSLLVRENEIVAVMAKRNASSTTFVLSSNSNETNTNRLDIRNDESTVYSAASDSAMSDCSHDNLNTQNPRFGSPAGPVQFLFESQVTNAGTDVFDADDGMDKSFESHVQAFANLLDNALADPNDDEALFTLDMYSFFQSAPKIHRRFKNSPRLKDLAIARPQFTNRAMVPSADGRFNIGGLLRSNPNGARMHAALYTFILREEIKQLGDLRASNGKPAPLVLPESLINHAFNNLEVMRFFAWESTFFAAYIDAALPPLIPSGTSTALAETPSYDPELGLRKENAQDGLSPDREGEDVGLDISTEFETGEAPTSSTAPAPVIHPCIQELRLITSNFEHLISLHRRAPKSRFRFQLIQYPPAGQSLKPWRELIHAGLPVVQRFSCASRFKNR